MNLDERLRTREQYRQFREATYCDMSVLMQVMDERAELGAMSEAQCIEVAEFFMRAANKARQLRMRSNAIYERGQ